MLSSLRVLGSFAFLFQSSIFLVFLNLPLQKFKRYSQVSLISHVLYINFCPRVGVVIIVCFPLHLPSRLFLWFQGSWVEGGVCSKSSIAETDCVHSPIRTCSIHACEILAFLSPHSLAYRYCVPHSNCWMNSSGFSGKSEFSHTALVIFPWHTSLLYSGDLENFPSNLRKFKKLTLLWLLQRIQSILEWWMTQNFNVEDWLPPQVARGHVSLCH